jgi:uncharacterized Zn finger protein
MKKPRYIVVPCPWCGGDVETKGKHWLVKRNILTSRALPAIAAFTTEAEAQAHADTLNNACKHNAMVRNGDDDVTHVWRCADCGYVYGTVTINKESV